MISAAVLGLVRRRYWVRVGSESHNELPRAISSVLTSINRKKKTLVLETRTVLYHCLRKDTTELTVGKDKNIVQYGEIRVRRGIKLKRKQNSCFE